MADPLSMSASLIAVLQLTAATVSTLYGYGNSVKNMSQDRKRIIEQLLGLQKALTDVQELVADADNTSVQLPSLGKLVSSPEGLPRYRNEMENLKNLLEGPLGRANRLQALIWPLKEGEVRKTLEYLRDFQQLLNSTVNTNHLGLTVEIRTDVKVLRDSSAVLAQSSEQARHEERRAKIYGWLSAPDHQLSHTGARKPRQHGTGLWFVNGESFKLWRDLPNAFLWLHGKMGSGKTILCSTVIDELSRRSGLDQPPVIAYFYFTNKQTQTNLAVRSLIKQLTLISKNIPDVLEQFYCQHLEGQQSPTPDSQTSTLKSIIASIPHLYIVLDALEECEDDNELLKLIKEVHGWGLPSLHLLATSRDEPDITDVMCSLASVKVHMDEHLIQDDIRLHIHQTLYRSDGFQKWSQEAKEKIETTLVNEAHGMFRWVDCQLDALRKCRTSAALKTALDSLPRTLYETYDRILCNIREDDRPSAIRVLQWLAFSVRPVALPELVEVLATNPHAAGGRYFNPDERLLDPREILTICSNLVTISEPVEGEVADIIHRYFLHRKKQAEVRLAHFSVREYLISDHFHGGGASLFFFNQNIAHTFIAKTCLTYLLQFDKPGDTDSFSIHQDFPLSGYAAKHWMHHARLANYGSDALQGLIIALFSAEAAMWANWLCLHDPDMTFFKVDNMLSGGPLYYTSLLGLGIPSQKLLEMGADVNACGGMYGTALQAAASHHHAEIVQLLLEKGADVNIQGGRSGTALQAASSDGDAKIVQLLLENGADVNIPGGRCGTALQAASSKGHANIAQLLLAKGADVNMQGRTGRTALQAASSNGHANIVRLLLEKGADANANAAGAIYGTALQDASSNGHAEVVRLLLEKGANMNVQGGIYGTALQAASSNNHTEIVQILLAKGADVNIQGVTRCTALQEASSKGHVDMVRLLLEKGADTNAQGGWRTTALQEASSGGHTEIVRLLLEKGADVNTVGGWQVALSGGHLRIITAGADDVSDAGGMVGKMLQVDSGGHGATLQLLGEEADRC